MNGKYLIINAGSSSLKFSLYDMPNVKEIVKGSFEKIGSEDSFYTIKHDGLKTEKKCYINNLGLSVNIMLKELVENKFIESIENITGVGHRVLHGGEFYDESVIIDDEVLDNIRLLTKLGPLHHPGEITGIECMKNALPDVPQIAVFDTAFHQTIPMENYLYAVPYDWYEENGVRKYGFHGTSHKYITETMQKRLSKKDVNLIICHIGSGASMCCVKDGKSYDTTMGLTPLDGLVMGTRCGNIDSSIIEYICKERKMTVEEVTSTLNKKSGLKGIAGMNDCRDLERESNNGNKRAILALKMLKNSIVKTIAQYNTELEGNVDAIVFTAGVGENSPIIRESVINDLKNSLGIELNKEENDSIGRSGTKSEGKITNDNSKIDVFVIPTNEEYMILKDTYNLSNEKQKEEKILLKNKKRGL